MKPDVSHIAIGCHIPASEVPEWKAQEPEGKVRAAFWKIPESLDPLATAEASVEWREFVAVHTGPNPEFPMTPNFLMWKRTK